MIIVAGLIIAFLLVLVFSNRATRNCRWRAVRSGDREGEAMYRCAACGAVVFTSTGKEPLHCRVTQPDKKE